MCARAGLNSDKTEVYRAKESSEVVKVINYTCYLIRARYSIDESTIYCNGRPMCLIFACRSVKSLLYTVLYRTRLIE